MSTMLCNCSNCRGKKTFTIKTIKAHMEKDKKSLASFENKPEFQKSIADFTVHILRNELALLETQVQAK